MTFQYEYPMLSMEELREVRHKAEDNSYRFSDVYLVRALQGLADAAGHVEGILGAYERIGEKP